MGPMQPFTLGSEGNETWTGSRKVATECRTLFFFSSFFFFIPACNTETTNGQWPAWLGPNKWLILCHAGPDVTPQTHTTSYARIPHSTYLAFVLHCVPFIPSLVPGPFKQLDIGALMVGLAALPGCRAAQHDKRPHHGSGESIVLRQYNAGRRTFFFFFFFKHTGAHFTTPCQMFVSFSFPRCRCFVLFFQLPVENSVCTGFNLLVWAHGVLVTRSVFKPALLLL